jgi:feruloyl esterase
MRTHTSFTYAAVAFAFGAVNAFSCTPRTFHTFLPSGTWVDFAYPMAANSTFDPPAGDTGFPYNATNLPALCAVSIGVNTEVSTSYHFGMFLPLEWNGRFL